MTEERCKIQNDRRVNKTLDSLSEALLELSKTKSFARISVRDLCEYAQINRSTFYMHFEDKYHLLTYVLAQISKECTAPTLSQMDGQPLLLLMSNEHYQDLYAEVLGNDELSRLLHDLIAQDIKDNMKAYLPKEKLDDAMFLDIVAEYHAGAIISVLHWWIKKGTDVPLSDLNCYFNAFPHPFSISKD